MRLNHSARQVLCHRGNYQQQENSPSRLLHKNPSEFICEQFGKHIHIHIILHIYRALIPSQTQQEECSSVLLKSSYTNTSSFVVH